MINEQLVLLLTQALALAKEETTPSVTNPPINTTSPSGFHISTPTNLPVNLDPQYSESGYVNWVTPLGLTQMDPGNREIYLGSGPGRDALLLIYARDPATRDKRYHAPDYMKKIV